MRTSKSDILLYMVEEGERLQKEEMKRQREQQIKEKTRAIDSVRKYFPDYFWDYCRFTTNSVRAINNFGKKGGQLRLVSHLVDNLVGKTGTIYITIRVKYYAKQLDSSYYYLKLTIGWSSSENSDYSVAHLSSNSFFSANDRKENDKRIKKLFAKLNLPIGPLEH